MALIDLPPSSMWEGFKTVIQIAVGFVWLFLQMTWKYLLLIVGIYLAKVAFSKISSKKNDLKKS